MTKTPTDSPAATRRKRSDGDTPPRLLEKWESSDSCRHCGHNIALIQWFGIDGERFVECVNYDECIEREKSMSTK